MSGYVQTGKLVSLRGTLVPATTLNKIIGSIFYNIGYLKKSNKSTNTEDNLIGMMASMLLHRSKEQGSSS